MDDVRYGVIGTGMMGIEHIENLRAIDGAVVTAVADRDERSRGMAIDAVGAVRQYDDHRRLLDDGDVDVVVIATPNVTHAQILLDVIDAGVPALVEKPLCTTIADCRRVADAAATAGAFVWVGLEYRYIPPIARLIDDATSGRLGRVRMVAIREHRFPFLVKVGNWNRFTRNTGGTLVEKCCHFFDLMCLIVGARPVRVMASGAQDVNHLDEVIDGEVPDMIDNAYVIVDFDDGARAMLDLCMFAEASRDQGEIVVVGDEAKAEALTPSMEHRFGRRLDGRLGVRIEQVADARVRYQGHHMGSSYLEHLDLLDALRRGTPPRVELAEGLRSVAVGVAAHRSIEVGRPVTLDEVLDDPSA